jgi:hypothetical protein
MLPPDKRGRPPEEVVDLAGLRATSDRGFLGGEVTLLAMVGAETFRTAAFVVGAFTGVLAAPGDLARAALAAVGLLRDPEGAEESDAVRFGVGTGGALFARASDAAVGA